MIVVDASVAVKLLLPEDGAEAARDLLAGSEPLLVPSVAGVEVPGAVLRKLRAGLLDEAEAKECIAIWNDLLREGVRVIPDLDLLDDAVRIARMCSHPLTDCLYVAAAVKMGAALVTADASLRSRCKRAHKRIALLGAAVPH
ncbi:MAG TPA: type II toxin-antitoxin system VapC family toxin [Phycisphaerae bacterium]|nr:type II toxin-antitoxin system VapC family toxin [Phycisphaerae bacterium]